MNTKGIYKNLYYEITQKGETTSYSIFDFGKVTGEKISLQFGSTNKNEYNKEYVKSEIDRIISSKIID